MERKRLNSPHFFGPQELSQLLSQAGAASQPHEGAGAEHPQLGAGAEHPHEGAGASQLLQAGAGAAHELQDSTTGAGAAHELQDWTTGAHVGAGAQAGAHVGAGAQAGAQLGAQAGAHLGARNAASRARRPPLPELPQEATGVPQLLPQLSYPPHAARRPKGPASETGAKMVPNKATIPNANKDLMDRSPKKDLGKLR